MLMILLFMHNNSIAKRKTARYNYFIRRFNNEIKEVRKLMKRLKRLISQLLVFVLVVTLVPITHIKEVKAGFNPTVTIIGKGDSRITSMLNAVSSQANIGSGKNLASYLVNTSKFRPKELGGSKFPYPNSSTSYFYTVTDGTYSKSINGAKGCMAYSNWVSRIFYGVDTGATKLYESDAAGSMKAANLKTFIQKNLQAGEHIRIDATHSVSYISCTNDGFYYLNYLNDSNPYISLMYVTYSNFASACNSVGKRIWVYNANTSTNASTSTGTNATSIKLDLYANQDGSVKLTWDNMGSYGVYVRRGTYSGDTKIIATVKNAKTWVDTTTQPSTSYYYYIQDIRNDDKIGVFSNGAGIASAAKITANVLSDGRVEFTWKNNTSYWGKFTVNRFDTETGKGECVGNFASTSSTVSFIDTSVNKNSYRYHVQPLNKNGVGCVYSNYIYVSSLVAMKNYTSTDTEYALIKAISGQKFDGPGVLTRSGYKFLGWYTAASGGVKVEFPLTATTKTQVIYAQWEKEPETQAPTTQPITTKPTTQQPMTTQAMDNETTVIYPTKEVTTQLVNNETTEEQNNKYENSNSSVTTKPAKVKLKNVKKISKKSVKISWKKQAGVNGYQIKYSTNKKFKKHNKLVTIKKASTTSKKIKKLKKKKTYYFKVRAYKVSGKTKVYGAWSKVKKVKIKK